MIIAPLPPMAISSVASLLGTTRNGKGGNDREEQVSRGQRQRQGGRIMLLSSTLAAAALAIVAQDQVVLHCRTARFRATANHIEPGRFAGSTRRKDGLPAGL